MLQLILKKPVHKFFSLLTTLKVGPKLLTVINLSKSYLLGSLLVLFFFYNYRLLSIDAGAVTINLEF